ncbi:hypothetical protein LINPERHAP2_LOCUS38885 [Linum perenne]
MATALLATAATFILLTDYIAVVNAGKTCGGEVPKTPEKYHGYVKHVLRILVDRTPNSPTVSYNSWFPDQRPGSVTGAATCYSIGPKLCSKCLRKVRDKLDKCTKSTAGGYHTGGCNMEFWLIPFPH